MLNEKARRVGRRTPTGVSGRWRKLAVKASVIALLAGMAGMSPAFADDGDVLASQNFTNIAYKDPIPATTKGNLLDIYLPERAKGEKLPLVIFSNGSAWTADSGKGGANTWAAALGSAGYAVAGVSIRSSSQVQAPGQIQDVHDAIRYLRAHADEYGFDPNRFAFAGFSSGAWAAAIAGTTGGSDNPLFWGTNPATEGVSDKVQAVVTYALPANFRTMDSQWGGDATWGVDENGLAVPPSGVGITGLQHNPTNSPESSLVGCKGGSMPAGLQDPDCVWADPASPVQNVSADDPPFLLMHGGSDNLLPFLQSQQMFDALAAACVDATFQWVAGQGHTGSYPASVQNVTRRVQQVDPSTCKKQPVRQYFGTADAPITDELPNFGYVQAFLDRVLAPTPPTAPSTQELLVNVPDAPPGEFGWTIDGDNGLVDLGTAEDHDGDYFDATGKINPIAVSDSRRSLAPWSISASVSDFKDGDKQFSGAYLGWTPQVLEAGAGAKASGSVSPGYDDHGAGLSVSRGLGWADQNHPKGTAKLGADLELKIPGSVDKGAYRATLTITALSS